MDGFSLIRSKDAKCWIARPFTGSDGDYGESLPLPFTLDADWRDVLGLVKSRLPNFKVVVDPSEQA